MDFQQFLADGPIQSLLALMAVPLLVAIILVGFLVFSFSRKRKKAKMKHGNQADASPEQKQLETNVNTLDSISTPETIDENRDSTPTDSLNLGILNKKVDGETIMEDSQKPSVEKNVDLAARLNMQTTAEETEPVTPVPAQKPVELLRLLRDSHSGQLIVEVSGEQYTKLADITDKKIGQFVLNVAAHFLAFTNGVIVTDAGIKNLGTPKVAVVPQPVVEPLSDSGPSPAAPQPQPDSLEQPLIPKPSPEAEAAFLASIQAMPLSEPPKPQKTGSFFSFGKSSTSSASQLSGGLGLNLAEEINEIVQNRLRYSPLAENYRVDIQTEPSGGIRIVVNGQIYSGADDVPDTEIRNLIKASIKEWEDR